MNAIILILDLEAMYKNIYVCLPHTMYGKYLVFVKDVDFQVVERDFVYEVVASESGLAVALELADGRV